MSEWSSALQNGSAQGGHLRTSPILSSTPAELQILLVACPRNHRYLQREVARFWRPLRILGRPEHRCQIPFQFDLEFALVRRQDDGVDEATKRFGGFGAGLRVLEGLRQCGDLLPI